MERLRHRTMEQFAKASGISRPTLSKYFEDPGSVRPSMRERIEAALLQSDYQPNIYARNLNRKRTKNIGIVVPHTTDPFYSELVNRLDQHCRAANYWPIIVSAHGTSNGEVEAYDLMFAVKAAGVIVTPLENRASEKLGALIETDVPLVYCDLAPDDRAPAVRNDNVQSIETMVSYLCRTGSAPAYLDGPVVSSNTIERRETYARAMEALGHEPVFLGRSRAGSTTHEAFAYDTMLDILDSGPLPATTILFSSDRAALGALAASFARRVSVGKRKSATLRIAGHDDIPISRYATPPLTTMAQDIDGIAASSVSLLLDLIAGNASPNATGGIDLPAKLMIRQSA
ncbi:LacI family DNA-binding transcriptional regulator [Aureimonas pseudogalii]|uniref:DNA-binding LacI/PurR family transcriptional regulator n=1 Tax=Aureimonas pseudogalii TaxID=1744844 RepID=A0A7W6H4E0_9HYPH|nr:LacI family DNA-binding transcriptional regulator [Aureimonas pseudogalii]MBB3998237.1 DNA-binding LacI/PurR family transcriptional regulator [Aureimonas pseudogalii]